MAVCEKCGKEIDYIEVGLYKKMINRGAVAYECKECLSAHLKIPVEILDYKVLEFRSWGCTLFPPLSKEEEETFRKMKAERE